MVVAQVVKIRNNTLRTFSIKAGDPFYTPRIYEKPIASGIIEVPPGFDEPVDGLVIPWAALTSDGMIISELPSSSEEEEGAPKEMIRCTVAPREEGPNGDMDYLQWHDADWEAIKPQRWTPVGKRHILGTIGGSSDWQITFRESKVMDDAQSALDQVLYFEKAVAVAPANTVFLNVFDLAEAVSVPNAILCNTVFSTIGAFHAAVEVYGEEWSFYRTPAAGACGVHKSSHARQHPVHVYRQSIDLGQTTLKDWEVRYLIRAKLAQKWPGGHYDLLQRNCIHFCDELCLSLGVKSVPPWVRGLHETGASVLRIPWPLTYIMGGSQEQQDQLTQGDGNLEEQENDADAANACVQRAEKGLTSSPTSTVVDGGRFVGFDKDKEVVPSVNVNVNTVNTSAEGSPRTHPITPRR